MGVISPNRRGPRRFSYEPRYYNPEKEQSLKRRMRIQSRSVRSRKSNTGLRLLIMAGLLGFALYILDALPWM